MVKTSRYLSIGPGGRNCSCCFPAPGSKDRRKQYRIAKRKADREAMKNAEADLIDQHLAESEELNAEYEMAYGPYGSPFDDPWEDYDYYEDLRMQEDNDDWDDDESYYDDDYGDSYDDYGDSYYVQSEQEKVARALSVALIGDENDWRQHLTHAKDFIAAMKRNTR